MSGAYGQSCGGVSHRDATEDLAGHCDGRLTCDYVLSGIAANTQACRSNFRAQWRCGNAEFHTAFLSANPRSGDTLVLSCKRENGPGK